MTGKKMTKAEWIIWLRDSIRSETAKAENKMDMDFVENCMDKFSVLLDEKFNFTGEELEEKLMQIKSAKKAESVKKAAGKINVKFRRAIAVCTAVMLLCGGITVYAFNPTIRDIILSIVDLPIGTSVEHAGITYIYHGKEIVYPDIKTLRENENLDIVCPSGSSDAAQIKRVMITEDQTQIWIDYVGDDLYTMIYKANGLELANIVNAEAERYNVNGVIFYIVEKEGQIISAALVEDWIYQINGTKRSQIIDILDCFK